MGKLKRLKRPIRNLRWKNGNLHDRVNFLRKELDKAQQLLDIDPSNVLLRNDESAIQNAFNIAVLDEEKFLRQKSKVEWLREGDRNTRYFHRIIKGKQHRSRINVIVDEHSFPAEDIPRAFVEYLQTVYLVFFGR